jgi:Ca-activated chloride channel homolog
VELTVAALHFLHPLWLLALPPLLGLACWFGLRDRSDDNWSRLIDKDLLDGLKLSGGRRGQSPWLWMGLLWSLAVVALAGPSWHRQQVDAFRQQDAWVVVLDLSPSMTTPDLPPDRVSRARYAIEDLLKAAHGRRVGLVVFAGDVHTVAPLTTDTATVNALLRPLRPALMPEPGDDLGPALDEAGRLLKGDGNGRGEVVVFSDGFADPVRAFDAARRLRAQGATVNVVGVGTATGGPQPDSQGNFARNAQGQISMSRLQSDVLQRVATTGDGRYVTLEGVPGLLDRLRESRSESADSSDDAKAVSQVATWSNDGVFLLPLLLLVAVMLARRGWV